jgi:hypothetical protein
MNDIRKDEGRLERQQTLRKDENLQSETKRESGKQGGAVEACWAHNPKVDRSRLSPAILARVAKWIRRPASNRKIVGSIPIVGNISFGSAIF